MHNAPTMVFVVVKQFFFFNLNVLLNLFDSVEFFSHGFFIRQRCTWHLTINPVWFVIKLFIFRLYYILIWCWSVCSAYVTHKRPCFFSHSRFFVAEYEGRKKNEYHKNIFITLHFSLMFCVATDWNYELKTFLSKTLIKVWHTRNMVVYLCLRAFLHETIFFFLYVDCQDRNIRLKRSFAHGILIINEIGWISKETLGFSF